MLKKNKKKYFSILLSSLFLWSSVSFAKSFDIVVKDFVDGTLANATKLAFFFAFMFFLYRLYAFMVHLGEDGDSEKVRENKKWLVYAIVLFFVFLSIFGLVKILKNSVNLNENKDINVRIDPKF